MIFIMGLVKQFYFGLWLKEEWGENILYFIPNSTYLTYILPVLTLPNIAVSTKIKMSLFSRRLQSPICDVNFFSHYIPVTSTSLLMV